MINENCFLCASSSLRDDSKNGYIICTSCGTIQVDVLSRYPEWSNYKDNVTRCNGSYNSLLPLGSVGTSISGNSRLKRANVWIQMPYSERSLYKVFKTIEEKCNLHFRSSIIKEAKYIFKSVTETNTPTRGENRRGLIAACVIQACKRNHINVTSKKIATIFGLSNASVRKGTKTLGVLIKDSKTCVGVETAGSIVKETWYRLRLNRDALNRAVSVAKEMERLALVYSSISIAAGCIYFTLRDRDKKITEKLSKELGIRPSTVCFVERIISKKIKEIRLSQEMEENIRSNFSKAPSSLFAKLLD